MKRFFCLLPLFFCLFSCCSCLASDENVDVVRVKIECDGQEERDETIRLVIDLLSGAESAEECKKRLSDRGYEITEEYYDLTRCGGKVFPAGYYPTCRVGEGEKGYQFIAYPSYVYQSWEEYNNARYGSFFYEIVKKMEERD